MRVSRRRKVAAPVGEVWKLIADPYSLPRWWPRTTRVENVERAGERRGEWTQVLETAEGRGVRADYRCVSSAQPSRYVWEQRIDGTPFERHLKASRMAIELGERGDETEISITSDQVLRGLSRLGSPLMRHGQAEIVDEALDGIERALDPGNDDG
jgi:uncharacterized protein YndB with AHSA1/START domain